MGTIKKITAVKRRALCPKCFSIIEWDNATFERYNSENDSYYIICPAELDGSNCGQEITINKINPDDYLDNDIVFEPVEGGTIVSIDSEDVNFNSTETSLNATNVKEAIEELEDNINGLNGYNISYNNTQSELDATNIQDAVNELASNIKNVDEKEIEAESIIYNNIDSDLESTNTQAAINELNEKINNISLDSDSITILLSEVKNTNDGIYFIFSGLNLLVNMLTDVSTGIASLVNYKTTLHITHPTFTNKCTCLVNYQSDSTNGEVLHIFINNVEIITVTTSSIIWKTADSRTVNIPVNAISSDGSYTYGVSQ